MRDTIHETEKKLTYTGACLCGGIQFEIQAELNPVQVCHCLQCRKAQGGPFATNIPVAKATFVLNSGSELLHQYESSTGKFRHFCKNCGSPVYSSRETLPDLVRVRAGLINESITAGVAFHAHVSSKCEWFPIDDDLPQFQEASVPAPD